MRLRQACVALSLTLGWAMAAGAEAAHEASPAVQALLSKAEGALAAGDAGVAQAAFEQAAALEHAARIEVGWVRARLQAGGYRQALAFAAHAAGAHPDEAEGAALYAQLLSLGGQEAAAQQVLARARERLPHDPLLAGGMQDACAPQADATVPPGVSPPALGDTPTRDAAVVASAVLLADGRHAVAPYRALSGARTVWLRNGLGRSSRAELLRHDEASGLAVLRLTAPLEAPTALAMAPRPAFAGSPAFAVGYRIETTGRPAWPQLCMGFLAAAPASGTPRPLGIGIPDGSAGAPVFDSAGRLSGMALPGAAPGLLTAQQFGAEVSLPTSTAGTALPLDELYERALRISLQVLKP